jgi:hypothetical protein
MTANQNEELVGFGLFEVNLARDIEVGVLFEILMRCGASDIWPCLALFFIVSRVAGEQECRC